jgi:hypothetical protein
MSASQPEALLILKGNSMAAAASSPIAKNVTKSPGPMNVSGGIT